MPSDRTALTRALMLTLAALPLAGAARAQSAVPAVEIDEIVVKGEAGASGTAPVNGYVAKATTAGAKTDLPIEKVPQSVSVVGREEIDARGADQVDEALRYTPGVFAQPFRAASTSTGCRTTATPSAASSPTATISSASRRCAAPPRCSTAAAIPAA
jgi:iron complex outermembrane receptor protein